MSAPFDHIVAALGERVTRRRDGQVQATCPAHDDRHASLSVSTGDQGTVLVKCFAGCGVDAIVASVGLSLSDLFERQGGGDPRPSPPRVEHSTTSPVGVTLAQYAEAKRLPLPFLRSLGLSDLSYQSHPAIRIPYLAPDGSEAAVQFRLGLDKTGDRFRWKSGAKPVPYGLDRLTVRPDTITLVEGPSDCHTLWWHEFAALGMPSATVWRSDWDRFLEGIGLIYVVIEPDRGGEAVEGWLEHASFRSRVRLVRLTDGADPSDAYLRDPATFAERWRAALADAVSWSDQQRARLQRVVEADFGLAQALLRDPHLLDCVGAAIRQDGYAGDVRPAQLAYLAITSRLLDRPLNLAFVAPSGAGKNRAVDAALRLHEDDAVHVVHAGSARSLIYCAETFEHRVVVFSEADSIPEEGPAASAVRSLVTDALMAYDVVEKNPATGQFETRHIVKPGPTGLLTTSTRSLPAQMATRVLEVSLRDDADQTRRVMKAHAQAVRPQPTGGGVDLDAFHALQRWLSRAGEHRVAVPFGDRLAELVPPGLVRMRRDFRQLLTTIQAVAFLHQLQRPRTVEGWVEASVEDYRIARDLLEPVFDAITQDAITPAVRETVLALTMGEEVSEPQLAERLQKSRSTVSYRVTRALAGGWLVNRESRKGYAARLALGVPLPEQTTALPLPERVFESSTGFPEHGDPPPPCDHVESRWGGESQHVGIVGRVADPNPSPAGGRGGDEISGT